MALSGAILFLLNACSSNRVEDARQSLQVQSQAAGFKSVVYQTPTFPLQGMLKVRSHNHLRIYIEGDGLAWFDTDVISDDPTPSHPIGYDLAAVDRSSSDVLYLARPCQFVRHAKCHEAYWTDSRFHQDVIDAYHHVLNQLKTEYKSFTLLAYSGGAAVALLLAAQRPDIKEVFTFVGTLDHQAWTQLHDFTPLKGSLNPINYSACLKSVKQVHFVGNQDETMPLAVANSYLKAIGDISRIQLIRTPYNHHEGWVEYWRNHMLNIKSE